MNKNKKNACKLLRQLDELFQDKKIVLVVQHDYPDPDSLASAMALEHLITTRYNLEVRLAYGGRIQRAENLAMVKELNMHQSQIRRLKLSRYDCIIMVDAQPAAGNHSLPADTPFDLVIDHHPLRKGASGRMSIIDPEVGASATLMVELLDTAGISIPATLSTALAYAIRTETQELGRETSKRDILAYLQVYAQASMQKLYRIAYPKLPKTYFQMLSTGLNEARSYRNIISLTMGDIENPEIVAEMADILLRHKRISWVICLGRYQNGLFISIRSSNPNAKAGQLIKKLVTDKRDAGGHDTFAGGRVSIENLTDEQIGKLENTMVLNFAKNLGYKQVEWKPLLGEGNAQN